MRGVETGKNAAETHLPLRWLTSCGPGTMASIGFAARPPIRIGTSGTGIPLGKLSGTFSNTADNWMNLPSISACNELAFTD